MLANTMEITNKLYEEIKNSEIIGDNNIVFSKGYPDISRSRFPFVAIDFPGYSEKQILAASGIFTYSFEIYIGTKNLVPGAALMGIEGGKIGVADLCKKVQTVIYKNPLRGTFCSVPYNIEIDPQNMSSSSGTEIVGKVSFNADVWFFHAA